MSDSFVTSWAVAYQASQCVGFLGKNTGVGCHFPLQGIFPTQGSNPCLLYWQADSLPLSHQGSRIVFPGSEIHGDFWRYVAKSCWFICRLFMNRGSWNNKSGILILIKRKKLSVWLSVVSPYLFFCFPLRYFTEDKVFFFKAYSVIVATYFLRVFSFSGIVFKCWEFRCELNRQKSQLTFSERI